MSELQSVTLFFETTLQAHRKETRRFSESLADFDAGTLACSRFGTPRVPRQNAHTRKLLLPAVRLSSPSVSAPGLLSEQFQSVAGKARKLYRGDCQQG